MSDPVNVAYQGIDREWRGESANIRQRFVQGACDTLGGLGAFGLIADDDAAATMAHNNPQTILNVAATAEILATIVNTVGPEKLDRARLWQRPGGRGRRHVDEVTKHNIQAAARQELMHYDVLKSMGARELTKRIWVPDAVFASCSGLLSALEIGDQILINAYLIGTTAFAAEGRAVEARYTGEFMGVEAVHRALARQSLGKLGTDRTFMSYAFTDILDVVTALQSAGFGLGAKGSARGRFYDFDDVKQRTPNPDGLSTPSPA
jgi:hypothetical protein